MKNLYKQHQAKDEDFMINALNDFTKEIIKDTPRGTRDGGAFYYLFSTSANVLE